MMTEMYVFLTVRINASSLQSHRQVIMLCHRIYLHVV